MFVKPFYLDIACDFEMFFRFNNKLSNSKHANKLSEQLEEMERDEGLAMLMPDIQSTATMVCEITDRLMGLDQDQNGDNVSESSTTTSLEERYLKIMNRLQFGECNILMIFNTKISSFWMLALKVNSTNSFFYILTFYLK